MNQTEILVGDPQIPIGIFSHGIHRAAGYVLLRNKPAILHVAELAESGGPDPPAAVLKQRSWVGAIEHPVWFVAADRSMHPPPRLCAPGAEDRDFPRLPSA